MSNNQENGYSFTQTIYIDIGEVTKEFKVRVMELIDLEENYSNYAIRLEYYSKEADGTYFMNILESESEVLEFSLKALLEKHNIESFSDLYQYFRKNFKKVREYRENDPDYKKYPEKDEAKRQLANYAMKKGTGE